jgi:hypothetical protein
MTIGEFRDLAQAVNAIVSSLTVIIGGSWAYWKFVIQKEREPRAEFDLSAEFIGHQNGKWVIEVSALLTNKGKVRHLIREPTINIRYITAADSVVESDDPALFGQVTFPHSIGRRKASWEGFLDPGLEFRNSYVAYVPMDATFVLLLCKFEYGRGKWPTQRVLKVPNAESVQMPMNA